MIVQVSISSSLKVLQRESKGLLSRAAGVSDLGSGSLPEHGLPAEDPGVCHTRSLRGRTYVYLSLQKGTGLEV